MAIIEVKNLTAAYGKLPPVVNDLSFELHHGETLGLCGSSGCGKTTVIWAILGVLNRLGGHAEGEILYENQNLLSLSEEQWRPIRWKKLAIVPQGSMSALNPVFTVKRTFRETLKVHKRLTSSAGERIENLIASVGLAPGVLSSYPHELSGGMLQRVSIALALLLDPEIIILDEATTGLDLLVEADILKLLMRIQSERGISMLFVSHDRRITEQFCHRRVML